MREVFADTAYWVALQFEKDSLRRFAKHWTLTEADSVLIVTSDLVLIEFLNFASGVGANTRLEVAEIWQRTHSNQEILVIPDTDHLLQAAVQLFKRSADKEWSLTDCASMLIMRGRGISEALTSDHHLEQAGFQLLMRI